MRSKTSFFNGEIIRRTVFRRYWPIMAVYGLIASFAAFILVYVTVISYDPNASITPESITGWQNSLLQLASFAAGIGGVGMGIILSRIAFGYLFSSDQVQFFHALPLKRESLFFSNFIAGALLFALPLLFGWIMLWLFSVLMGILWLISVGTMFQLLLVLLATHLFFYSFAVVIAHLTGHGVAHLFIYAVFNCLTLFLYLMSQVVFRRYLFGLDITYMPEVVDQIVRVLSPAVMMVRGVILEETPIANYLYGLAGIALMPVALLLYKKRALETNGDVIAFNFLKPIFQAGFAVCFTLIFSAFLIATEINIPETALSLTILLFALVGFYLARMLINKTFHVFKGSVKGVGVFMAAVLLCVCALQFDFIGFERRIPNAGDVAFVVCKPSHSYEEYDEANVALNRSWWNRNMASVSPELLDDMAFEARSLSTHIFEGTEGIETAIEMHRQIVDNENSLKEFQRYDPNANPYLQYFTITYVLKDGTIINRTYNSLDSNQVAQYVPAAETLFNTQEHLMRRFQNPLIAEGLVVGGALTDIFNEMNYDSYGEPVLIDQGFNAEAAQGLYNAIIADAKNGNIGMYYGAAKGAFENEVSFINAQVFFRTPPHPFLKYIPDAPAASARHEETNQLKVLSVCITTRSENVLAWMEENGVDTRIVTQRRELSEEYSYTIFNYHNRYHGSYNGRIERDYSNNTSAYATFESSTN